MLPGTSPQAVTDSGKDIDLDRKWTRPDVLDEVTLDTTGKLLENNYNNALP